jgi:hypothetical protein
MIRRQQKTRRTESRTDCSRKCRSFEVEDAMIVTMRKNGIELPPSFLTGASGFKPKLPPQTRDVKKKDDKRRIDSPISRQSTPGS